jgi:hypothetical protein
MRGIVLSSYYTEPERKIPATRAGITSDQQMAVNTDFIRKKHFVCETLCHLQLWVVMFVGTVNFFLGDPMNFTKLEKYVQHKPQSDE